MRRAAPMPREERRAALVSATLGLIRERGLEVNTRQIAAAAGVAEGTIFRVFETKDELVHAALASAFDPGPLLDRIHRIDGTLPLTERLVAAVGELQQHFVGVFEVMSVAGLVEPPKDRCDTDRDAERRSRESVDVLVRLIGEDAEGLRCSATELVRVLRLLTFSASHPRISGGRVLTPEQIVDIVLHGLCRTDHTTADPFMGG